MSSEESSDETDVTVVSKRARVTRPLFWQSIRLRVMKEELDNEYIQHHTTERQRRATAPVSTSSRLSLRQQPKTAPHWAVV